MVKALSIDYLQSIKVFVYEEHFESAKVLLDGKSKKKCILSLYFKLKEFILNFLLHHMYFEIKDIEYHEIIDVFEMQSILRNNNKYWLYYFKSDDEKRELDKAMSALKIYQA